MVSNRDAWGDSESAAEDKEVIPLSPEQAQALQRAQPSLSIPAVFAGQCVVAVASVLLLLFLGLPRVYELSVALGVAAVLLPQALMVALVGRKVGQLPAPVWLARLFVWEVVKLVLTLALVVLGARWVGHVSWWVLLLAFILTLKTGWLVAFLLHRRAQLGQSTE